MSSEGSREIEAARKRLLAAKSQAYAASKNMKSVEEMIAKMRENAQSLVQSSSREVKEAEAMLEDAEKRWEVIEIDADTTDSKNEICKKKRKVSLSPQAGNNISSSNTEASTVGRSNDGNSIFGIRRVDGGRMVGQVVGAFSAADGLQQRAGISSTCTAAAGTSNNVDQFFVEGCGVSIFNGVYNRVAEVVQEGAPVYCKKVNEGMVTLAGQKNLLPFYLVIFRSSHHGRSNHWCIAEWYGDINAGIGLPGLELGPYISYQNANCLAPPEHGWISITTTGIQSASSNAQAAEEINRKNPAPTCRPNRSNFHEVSTSTVTPYEDKIVVEGCGTTELNGTYRIYKYDVHHGAPYYTKTGVWEGIEQTFAIFRESSKTKTNVWCIGRSTVGTHGTPFNMTMFRSKDNANCMTPSQHRGGWCIVGRTRGGVYPAPRCRVNAVTGRVFTSGEAASTRGAVGNATQSVEQVTIEGCGLNEVNGIYKRTDEQSNGAPEYTKWGQWKGRRVRFDIWCGITLSQQLRWYIQADCIDHLYCAAPTLGNPKIPPMERWEIIGSGVHPAPRLIYVIKE